MADVRRRVRAWIRSDLDGMATDQVVFLLKRPGQLLRLVVFLAGSFLLMHVLGAWFDLEPRWWLDGGRNAALLFLAVIYQSLFVSPLVRALAG